VSGLDPSTWPDWLKLLAGWGPLGIWAGISEIRRVRAERGHHASRDGAAADLAKVHADAAAELAKVHTHYEHEAHKAQVAHLEDVKMLNEEHQAQLKEVMARCLKLLERQSEKAHVLMAKVDAKKLSDSPETGESGTVTPGGT
jgi:hypothetical protein